MVLATGVTLLYGRDAGRSSHDDEVVDDDDDDVGRNLPQYQIPYP